MKCRRPKSERDATPEIQGRIVLICGSLADVELIRASDFGITSAFGA